MYSITGLGYSWMHSYLLLLMSTQTSENKTHNVQSRIENVADIHMRGRVWGWKGMSGEGRQYSIIEY